MPRGNGMGPMGMGPMTGRGAGYCAGFGMPGYANPFVGNGMGFGRGAGGRGFGGGGRGWRNMFYATGLPGWARFGGSAAPFGYAAPYGAPDPEAEKQALKNQAEAMKNELDLVNKRLGELEEKTGAE